MSDDLTVATKPPPPVRVRVRLGDSWSAEQRFAQAFSIGRSTDCQVIVPERAVSRVHAEVRFEAGRWWLVDLHSRHGLYIDGRQVAREALQETVTVELGPGGPAVWLAVGDELAFSDQPTEVGQAGKKIDSVTEIFDRWKRGDITQESEEARRYREAAMRRERQQKRRYRVVVGGVFLLLVCALGYGWYQKLKFDGMMRTAGEMFYAMKQVEIQVSDLEEEIAETKRKDLMERILTKRQRLRELEAQYDRFLSQLDIYESMSEQDRVIFHMARLFGECEVTTTQTVLGPKDGEKRPVTLITVIHPTPRRNFRFYKAEVYLDNELQVPIRYAAYMWPQNPGEQPPLEEEYTYLNLEVNKGFNDFTFSRDNPELFRKD